MAAATPAAHGLVNSTFIPIDTRLGQRAVDFRAQLGFATRVQKAGVEGRLRKLGHITQRETHLTHEHAVLARDVGAKGQGVVGVHRAAHARLAQGAERVRVVAARHFQQDIAGRAHVQKHAGCCQIVYQAGGLQPHARHGRCG